MDSTEKDLFASITELGKFAWAQFNERRKYEFQMSIAVWTALSAFSAFVFTRGNAMLSLDICSRWLIFLVLVLLMFFICYNYREWIKGLAIANDRDKKKALFYEEALQKIAKVEFGENRECYLKYGLATKTLPKVDSNNSSGQGSVNHLIIPDLSEIPKDAYTPWSHGTLKNITYSFAAIALLATASIIFSGPAPSCKQVPAESNQITIDSLQDQIVKLKGQIQDQIKGQEKEIKACQTRTDSLIKEMEERQLPAPKGSPKKGG